MVGNLIFTREYLNTCHLFLKTKIIHNKPNSLNTSHKNVHEVMSYNTWDTYSFLGEVTTYLYSLVFLSYLSAASEIYKKLF